MGGRCFVYRASVTHLDKNIELNQDQIGWLSRGPVAEMLQHEWMSAMHRGMAAVGAHARTQRLHMCLETPICNNNVDRCQGICSCDPVVQQHEASGRCNLATSAPVYLATPRRLEVQAVGGRGVQRSAAVVIQIAVHT